MPYYYDLPELRPVAPELEVPALIIPDYTNTKTTSSPPEYHHHGMVHYQTPSKQHYSPDQLHYSSSQHTAPWRQPAPVGKKSCKPSTQQQRRKRTVFTAEELAILNSYYEVNKFLNPGLKAEILEKVDVPGNVLVMWYQNKRAKDRANGMII
eukprot:sb/3473421/